MMTMMLMKRALQWLGDNLIITKKNTMAMMVKSSKAVAIKYSAGYCS